MKILLLTVAGVSSRFCKSLGRQTAKCIFYENDFKEALLSKMLFRHRFFEKIVIVGGFEFEKIKSFCKKHFSKIFSKMIFVENKNYATTGTALSFCLGLEAAKNFKYDELVFAEGDLFVDDAGFKKVCSSKKNVITVNADFIFAKKSVALYFDKNEKPHYIYDSCHATLQIREPFVSIFNSAQIWKFTDSKKLNCTLASLTKKEREGVNLVPIEKYFAKLKKQEIEIVSFKNWINCNTVQDFRTICKTKIFLS